MSRPKIDPVERAFDAFVALSPEENKRYYAMLDGYARAHQSKPDPKPARVRKVKAPAEVAGA